MGAGEPGEAGKAGPETRGRAADGGATLRADGGATLRADGGATLRGPAWRVRPFQAPQWARSPHLQTLAGKFLRPEPAVPLRRERWDTPDGDLLLVDFADEGMEDAPLVVVLHGLEGSARRRYALCTYRELRSRGLAAVGMNFRSCGGEPNRLARAYHSGETGDLAFVVERLAERFPGRTLGAVGYSLGGNVLLKALGESGGGGAGVFGAAAAVSVPYDLDAGCRLLERSFMGRAYMRYFTRSLAGKVREKSHLFPPEIDLDRVVRSRTLREFDDLATAPLHGFRDAAHYYEESSSAAFLPRIRVPTLLLHSLDDPFLPEDAVPEAAVEENPWLVAGFTERGGHVGFVEGTPWRPRFWAEAEVARFLGEVLGG